MLFDAVGTLIELREPVGETYARLARTHGVDLPAWRITDAFARIHRQAPPMVFPGTPPKEIAQAERRWWREIVRGTFLATDGTARFPDFDAYFESLYRTFTRPEAWRRSTGSRTALAALRARGLATGVVSNFDQRLHQILEGLDLDGFFDVVVLPASVGAAKPDARIFRVALERLGRGAAETVYVGDDREHDLEGARAAGLRAIDARALATLAELPNRVEALNRGSP
ncbi:MAG: HAD-IA family hydrolase [Myxococcales bacterium]|nr:HAD-IA family hydrolase [Myxococcales bacterium]